SITLDLKSEAGQRAVRDLIQNADIVVENFNPGVMDRLGLGYEQIKKLNPKIVMTSISNFGQTGEYKNHQATELVSQAMSGWTTSVGEIEREPLRAAGKLRMLEYLAGSFAALSTLTAVLERSRSGKGV